MTGGVHIRYNVYRFLLKLDRFIHKVAFSFTLSGMRASIDKVLFTPASVALHDFTLLVARVLPSSQTFSNRLPTFWPLSLSFAFEDCL